MFLTIQGLCTTISLAGLILKLITESVVCECISSFVVVVVVVVVDMLLLDSLCKKTSEIWGII